MNRVKIVDKKIIDVSSFRNELDETSFRQARTIQKFFEENLKKGMSTSEKAGFVRNVLEFSKRHGDKARAYLNSMLTLYVKKGQQVLPISDGVYLETEFITNRMSKFKVFDKGFSSISVIITE